MKKSLLFLLLVFVLFSCKKEQYITLSDTSITMYYDDEKQLSLSYSSDELADLTYKYTTSDTNIATVSSSGLISGVSIGTATITVTSEDGEYAAQCTVTITPKYTFYTEPYMNWGCSIQDVKDWEFRTIQSETSTMLVFNGEYSYINSVAYSFEDSTLKNSMLLFDLPSSIVENGITEYILERYAYDRTMGGYDIFHHRSLNIGCVLMIQESVVVVGYMSKSQAKNIKSMDLKNSILNNQNKVYTQNLK